MGFRQLIRVIFISLALLCCGIAFANDVLDRQVSANFNRTSLKATLDQVLQGTGLNAQIDKGVDGQITAGFNSITLRSALTLILSQVGATYRVEGNSVHVVPNLKIRRVAIMHPPLGTGTFDKFKTEELDLAPTKKPPATDIHADTTELDSTATHEPDKGDGSQTPVATDPEGINDIPQMGKIYLQPINDVMYMGRQQTFSAWITFADAPTPDDAKGATVKPGNIAKHVDLELDFDPDFFELDPGDKRIQSATIPDANQSPGSFHVEWRLRPIHLGTPNPTTLRVRAKNGNILSEAQYPTKISFILPDTPQYVLIQHWQWPTFGFPTLAAIGVPVGKWWKKKFGPKRRARKKKAEPAAEPVEKEEPKK